MLSLLIATTGLYAQEIKNPEAAELLKEDHTRAGINSNCYEFCKIRDTPAPKGYKPFYISHYGRHGARSDWGEVTYRRLVDVLTKAKAQGILTSGGDSLLLGASEIVRLHDGMEGRLTSKGVSEQKRLADRMFNRYKKVFKSGDGYVRAISSTVPRCLVSMTAFTNELTALDPDLDISWDTGEKFYAYINNSCPDDVYKASQILMDSLNRSYLPDTNYVMVRLFTDKAAARKLIPSIGSFQKDIFTTGRIADPFDVKIDILGFLPFDALYKYWDNLNMYMYLRHCNSKEFGAERVAEASALADDIVWRADEAIASGKVCADLRFGHDFPAMAIASYLGIEGIGNRYSFEEAQRNWNGILYIPFSMNIQMVFYHNREGNVLVKFLMNEKEALLRNLEPVSGPYYDWDTVKANIKGYLR